MSDNADEKMDLNETADTNDLAFSNDAQLVDSDYDDDGYYSAASLSSGAEDFMFDDEPKSTPQATIPPNSSGNAPEVGPNSNNNIELMISFKDDLYPVTVPKSATVKQLKDAVCAKTGVVPDRQTFIGFKDSVRDLLAMNEFPLEALGIEHLQSVLLQEKFLAPENPFESGKLNVNDLSQLLDTTAVDEKEFTAKFEEDYGSTHPIFLGGSYSETAKLAKSSFRLMVVNLQANKTQNNLYCRNVLTNPNLAQFCSLNFLFWVGFLDEEKEQQIKDLTGVTFQFPFLAVVGHLETGFNVLEVMQGAQLVDPDNLMAKLMQVQENSKASLDKARITYNRRQAERRVVEEQNYAFNRSLLEDQEKERKRKEEADRVALEKETKESKLKAAREACLKALSELPAAPSAEELQGQRAATLAIKLPDGSRIKRTFPPDVTFQAVLTLAAGTIAERLTDTTFLDDSTPFDHPDPKPWSIESYEFVANYPRRVFHTDSAPKTLKELGLYPQAMLFLQPRRT